MTATLTKNVDIPVRLAGNKPVARLLQLDILRGVAILLVIGRHFVINASPDPAPKWNGSIADYVSGMFATSGAGYLLPLAGAWQRFGWTGVDLFFVLSGFLIGGLLFSEIRQRGRLDVKRFIIRRGFKIWPSYYLYLGFIAAAAYFFHYPQPPSVAEIVGPDGSQTIQVNEPYITQDEANAPLWPCLLHIQNYYRIIDKNHHPIPSMPRPHLWSLAVEEHFYLVLPFVLLLGLWLAPRPREQLLIVPITAAAVMIACTLMRCFTHNLVPFPWGTHVYPTHMRVDGLFFGVLLAYMYHYHSWFRPWMARYRLPLAVIGVALVSPMIFVQMEHNRWVPAVGFSMLYIGYGCILLAALATPADSLMTARGIFKMPALLLRGIGWVGLFSYPIYLWHMDLARFPVRYLVEWKIFENLPATLRWASVTGIYVCLAIATGAIMSIAIEKPTLFLRDYFFPRRAAALPANATPTST